MKTFLETKEMDRREFLKKTAGAAACTALAISLEGSLSRLWAQARPDVVIGKGDPGRATRATVDALGGIGRFVQKGAKVVIKPNMSFPNPPEWGSTTNPDVVRELVNLCLQAGASSVLVLDNPLRNAELCLERSQLKAACSGFPKTYVEGLTNKEFYKEVRVPQGKALTSTMVMKQVLEADALIAAPVAKSHSATGVSMAMKGMMGLIYDRRPFHLGLDLNTAIVDLCTVLKPALTLVDASRLLSDNGPGGPGKVIPLKRIIASTDMVAADAMAVEMGTWYGRKFKADQVKHIKMAHERGLGNMDVSALRIVEVDA